MDSMYGCSIGNVAPWSRRLLTNYLSGGDLGERIGQSVLPTRAWDPDDGKIIGSASDTIESTPTPVPAPTHAWDPDDGKIVTPYVRAHNTSTCGGK